MKRKSLSLITVAALTVAVAQAQQPPPPGDLRPQPNPGAPGTTHGMMGFPAMGAPMGAGRLPGPPMRRPGMAGMESGAPGMAEPPDAGIPGGPMRGRAMDGPAVEPPMAAPGIVGPAMGLEAGGPAGPVPRERGDLMDRPAGDRHGRRARGPGIDNQPDMGPSQPSPFTDSLFPPELVMQNQRALGLGAEQTSAIRTAMHDTVMRCMDLQWKQSAEEESLAAITKQAHPDEGKAVAQLDKLIGLENEIKRARLQLLVKVKNLLSEEQQEKLRSLGRQFPLPPQMEQADRPAGELRGPGAGVPGVTPPPPGSELNRPLPPNEGPGI